MTPGTTHTLGMQHHALPGSSAARWRVLLVDDDASTRYVLCAMLSQAGLLVQVASGGKEALALLTDQQRIFDAVLTDLRMPEGDGLDILYGLTPKRKMNVPVIVMSADEACESQTACMHAGAACYLVKPLQANNLLQLICALCSSRPAAENPLASALNIAPKQLAGLKEGLSAVFCQFDPPSGPKKLNHSNSCSAFSAFFPREEDGASTSAGTANTTPQLSPVISEPKAEQPSATDAVQTMAPQIPCFPLFPFPIPQSNMVFPPPTCFFPFHSPAPSSIKSTSSAQSVQVETLQPPPGPPLSIPQRQASTPAESSRAPAVSTSFTTEKAGTSAGVEVPIKIKSSESSSDSSSAPSKSYASRRALALTKFREKRKNLSFEKKVRYASRKRLAENRPRFRGQFVKRDLQPNIMPELFVG